MGVHKRRWRRRRPDIAPAPDRLNRDFTAARPNQRWVADITEFPTGEGKLHLAGVRDLCHRGLVGWSMGARPRRRARRRRARHGARSSRARRRRARAPLRSGRRLRVGRLLLDGRPRRPAGQLRVDRRLLGQRRHGDVLVDPQTRDRLDPRQPSGSRPATTPGSTSSSSSRSSTTANATRPPSGTRHPSSSPPRSAPDNRNPVSTRAGQGQPLGWAIDLWSCLSSLHIGGCGTPVVRTFAPTRLSKERRR